MGVGFSFRRIGGSFFKKYSGIISGAKGVWRFVMGSWPDFLSDKAVDAMTEIGAYEYLWQQPSSSTKKLAELLPLIRGVFLLS